MITADTIATVLDPIREADPDDQAQWWRGLSEADREAAITLAPQDLGSLDGIPGWVLDRVLRAGIPNQLERLRQEQAQSGADREQEFADKFASVAELQAVLAEPERMLLALNLSGSRARAAVSVGNVDTAVHIGVYTPGMGSTVQGCLARYDDEMDRLRSKAIALGTDPKDIATVTWLGYDAPLGVVDVAQRDAAIAGSRLLQRFTDGMISPREDRFHLVAIGQGAKPSAWMAEVLAARSRYAAAPTFSPDGLYFLGPVYDASWNIPERTPAFDWLP